MAALIVDSRETNSGIPGMLRAAGVELVQQEMSAGDYQIGDLLIERKNAVDLAASIMSGHMFGQAEALCMSSHRVMLLVEGDYNAIRSQMQEEALFGAIAALGNFWQFSVMWTSDTAATARLLARWWRQAHEGLGYEVPLRVRKPKPSPDGALAQYVVEGLPGVGPETARKLVSHFGSPRAVFAAGAHQLRECKGIGPKTADSIAAALDLRPTAYRQTKGPPAAHD
jgi:ERCC4-type nuclease